MLFNSREELIKVIEGLEKTEPEEIKQMVITRRM